MTRTLLRSLIVVGLLLLVTVPASAQSDPDFPMSATVTRNANLRAGPGTSYAVAGSARAGEAITLVGENAAGDWYELASGEWIAAFLVTVDAPAAAPATPAARASAAELQRYTDDAIPYTQLIGEGLDAMSELLLAPEPENVDWLVALYTALGVIQGGHELLMDVTPPPSLVPVHEQLLAGTQDCNDATHAIMDGIENVDVAELERAFTLLESCTQKTEASLAMMEAYEADIAATPTATVTPTRTPTATRQATPTASSTPTRRPSATPTRTPIPPTPSPTAVSLAHSTAVEIEQYVNKLLPPLNVQATALWRINDLMQTINPNDRNWMADLSEQFSIVQNAHQDLIEIEPPPGLFATHQLITEGSRNCTEATIAVTNGFADGNPSELQRAYNLFTSCTQKIKAGQATIDSYYVYSFLTPTAPALPTTPTPRPNSPWPPR